MNFPRFALERWQSTFENSIEYNLSESGVHPLTVSELGINADDLLKCRLGYGVSNGTERFRSLVAHRAALLLMSALVRNHFVLRRRHQTFRAGTLLAGG